MLSANAYCPFTTSPSRFCSGTLPLSSANTARHIWSPGDSVNFGHAFSQSHALAIPAIPPGAGCGVGGVNGAGGGGAGGKAGISRGGGSCAAARAENETVKEATAKLRSVMTPPAPVLQSLTERSRRGTFDVPTSLRLPLGVTEGVLRSGPD